MHQPVRTQITWLALITLFWVLPACQFLSQHPVRGSWIAIKSINAGQQFSAPAFWQLEQEVGYFYQANHQVQAGQIAYQDGFLVVPTQNPTNSTTALARGQAYQFWAHYSGMVSLALPNSADTLWLLPAQTMARQYLLALDTLLPNTNGVTFTLQNELSLRLPLYLQSPDSLNVISQDSSLVVARVHNSVVGVLQLPGRPAAFLNAGTYANGTLQGIGYLPAKPDSSFMFEVALKK